MKLHSRQLFEWPLFKTLLAGFLKPPCLLCQRPVACSAFCLDCDRQIQSCRWPIQDSDQDDVVPTALPVMAWGIYNGPLKRALHRLKYQDCPELAVPLGRHLGQLWQQAKALQRQAQDRPIVVVPIPLHSARLRQRGYNQAELIAKSFCRMTRLPCLPHGLLRVRATEVQHQLGPTNRQENMRSAFRLGPDWTLACMSSAVLLVDDIYTTGATAQVAATELQQAGLRVLGIATVARAIRRHPGATGVAPRLEDQRPRLRLTP